MKTLSVWREECIESFHCQVSTIFQFAAGLLNFLNNSWRERECFSFFCVAALVVILKTSVMNAYVTFQGPCRLSALSIKCERIFDNLYTDRV